MTYIRRSVIKIEGGQRETRTSDDNAQELFKKILEQLKIIAFHMSQVTDNDIKVSDIGEETE